MTDSYRSFEGTPLWKTLSKRTTAAAEETKRHLRTVMPMIEAVLKSGGTSPLDFTLHDEAHAFRVAERMAEVMPEETLNHLTEYELGLLLLAAYLHDIGMTPERAKVQQHYRYLLTSVEDALTELEKDQLQEWLDDHGYGSAGSLLEEIPASDRLPFVEYVVAHYCRHRHNDWSEEWIRNNLVQFKWGGYADWIGDVVLVCRSHHEGYSRLIRNIFEPKMVPGIGEPRVVHLRYIACVLRIADILEFDPERTPEVIFQHRSISPTSAIFWHKDRGIARVFDRQRKQLLVTAYPENAQLHRAIQTMVEDINTELTLCRRLADETHFEKFPGPLEDTKHRWDLPYAVHDQIRPKDDAYVFIDGAFRPDTPKLLQLLSGQALYATGYAAVRELLQNAFDATKELLAREWLSSHSRETATATQLKSDRYAVRLRLEREGDRYLLTCSDEGVGMSKHIIERYLLVSGAGKRHDILELERKCVRAGFQLGRTGQFGIGVLSYFMLADRVTIKTRRHVRCDDGDSTGWIFESTGIGSFGELRKQPSKIQGTDVTLVLKADVITNVEVFCHSLKEFVLKSVLWCPCRLILELGDINMDIAAGWTRQQADIANEVADLMFKDVEHRQETSIPVSMLPKAKQIEHQTFLEQSAVLRNEILQHVRLQVVEGELQDGLGHYRLHIPYFDINGGRAVAFLKYHINGNAAYIGSFEGEVVFVPKSSVRNAWRGMYLLHDRLGLRGVVTEVNWVSQDAGGVSVDRSRLTLSADATGSLESLKCYARQLSKDQVEKFDDEEFGLLNARIRGCKLPSRGLKWVKEARKDVLEWNHITFPATSSTMFAYERYSSRYLDGKPISIIPSLGPRTEQARYKGYGWNPRSLSPDRVVVDLAGLRKCIAIWEGPPTNEQFQRLIKSKLPPNWQDIVGIRIEHYSATNESAVIWNVDNPFVDGLSAEEYEFIDNSMKAGKPLADPLSLELELGRNKGRATAFIAWCLAEGQKNLWLGMAERDPQFMDGLWKLVFGSTTSRIRYVNSNSLLRKVGSQSWEVIQPKTDWGLLIPDFLDLPPKDWLLMPKRQENDFDGESPEVS